MNGERVEHQSISATAEDVMKIQSYRQQEGIKDDRDKRKELAAR